MENACDLTLTVDFVYKTINATLSLLHAAKRVPSVKRIVLTTSSNAVIAPPSRTDKVLRDDDWNDESITKFHRRCGEVCPSWHVYGVGKALAERAAWEFVENEKVKPFPCLRKMVMEANPCL
jgi:nucleoside-diphosphate-sugar epimerase